MWMKNRSSDFWDRIVNSNFEEEDWLENFRMSKETFQLMCFKLNDFLKPSENAVRQPLSVEKKVAIALYKLASCAEYRVVASLFGVHKSSVHNCVYDVCIAIITVLGPSYLKMPSVTEAIALAESVEKVTGMVQIFGAIDGTHIPILPPTNGYRDFVNRKGWPSIVMQGIVDCNYLFRDITVKHPGSVHDATVLKDSNIFKQSKDKLPNHCRIISDCSIQLMLAGDPAYPLLPWLLKGYTGALTPEEESFNTYLSSVRICVENAFGRLKARWRVLLKRADINYKFMPSIVHSCVILHNIIENSKDNFNPCWLRSVNEVNIERPQPRQVTVTRAEPQAKDIREVLKNYMYNNYPLRQSSVQNYVRHTV
ncbi:uncharacterized protein LOC132932573 [Metopolophium dirhodum]|uniref:uncharacterized protein LOC132932573 n=1 Tax=Metopolophium dirhodum TaxID=44670 RepID=UPI00299067C0|nr:uncharacterized protein LOC132932573 [Metopolophium dirhodum]